MESGPHTAAARRIGDPTIDRIVVGNVGDHVLVVELLRAAGHAHSAEDFASWLDEPSYEPADRLVVRREGRIAGHVQVLFRTAWFGGVKLPVAGLIDLAVLPELQLAGWESRLLAAAEQLMRDEGAIVSVVRTDRPDALAHAGWAAARSQGFTQANTRDILSHLTTQAAIRRPGKAPFHVRLWRHFELEALMPVYRAAAHGRWGALARSEPYWHWLMTRKAHDRVIVAIEGPDPAHDLEESDAPREESGPIPDKAHSMPRIVAYAVVQGSGVIELCCRPEYEVALPHVLARACQDAIEQDHHTITLHTAVDDPMHEVLVTAGGTWSSNAKTANGSLMAKLLDPVRWIEQMYPLLHCRAKKSGVQRPCEFGMAVDDCRYRFRLTRRSSRLEPCSTAAEDVRCDELTLGSLLVGNASAACLLESGRLIVHQEDVARHLTALFPGQLFWQSPLDVLRF